MADDTNPTPPFDSYDAARARLERLEAAGAFTPREREHDEPRQPEEVLAELGGELSKLRERVTSLEAELRAGFEAVGKALASARPGGPAAPGLAPVALPALGWAESMSDAQRDEYRRGLGFIR